MQHHLHHRELVQIGVEQRSNNHDGANWTTGKTEGLARPTASTHARAARPVRANLTHVTRMHPDSARRRAALAGRHKLITKTYKSRCPMLHAALDVTLQ
jgi:hypothetical protein